MVSWHNKTDVPLNGWPWFCRCHSAVARRAARARLKTFVSKLHPTTAQAAWLAETLDTCRQLANHALSEREIAYRERGESIGFARQCASLPARKRTWTSLLRVHFLVVQDVAHWGERAFHAFVRQVKNGETPGFPRCKGWGRYDSFTYPQWGNGVTLDKKRLTLSTIGTVRLHTDRPLEDTPKTCAIIRKADGWHERIACDVAPSPLPPTGKAIGVDVGLGLSKGTQIANPRCYRAAAKSISDAGWSLFLSARRAKAAGAGRVAREVNSAGTSQTCAACGARSQAACRAVALLPVVWVCVAPRSSCRTHDRAEGRGRRLRGGPAVGRTAEPGTPQPIAVGVSE